MRILFGREQFSAGLPWEGLSPFLAGHEIVTCSRNGLPVHIENTDVVVPFGSRVDRALIEQGHFGLIQQFGVGLDTVDIPAATEAGVWVANLPSGPTGNADSVAELTIMQMLMLARRLHQVYETWGAGTWSQRPGVGLFGKSACILGLGDLGVALARRLHAFDMTLTGLRLRPEQGAPDGIPFQHIFGPDALEEALHEADYVIVCIKYTPENHHLINAAALQAMKPGAFLINVARGGLIDHDALLHALESGHLAGAGLDVFWEEPVALDHPFFRQNVVVTPHIGGLTESFFQQGAHVFAANIERFARGDAPLYAVNRPAHPRYP
jgi:phosphoglycerate dehydrogenase-like enzyme